MPKWRWVLTQITKRLWLRATLIGFLGVAAAMLAAVVERFIPWPLPSTIGAEAVGSILNIIASSMLAVTTFSLSVMTAAYGAASNSATPRATKLLMEDKVTQTVLSTFIGSFLFSIVGIVVLQTGAYGERGRFVLFVVTVAVIVLIVMSLLRWIEHLTRLGRLGETTARVEQAAQQAIAERIAEPYLGANPLWQPQSEIPADALPIHAGCIGYVQHIDMTALSEAAEKIESRIFITAIPGTFAYTDTALAWLEATTATKEQLDITDILRNAFTVGNERSFEQDPRFGLAVMCEVGSRALSPATNDPGTAIDVINRITRLMALWADNCNTRNKAEEQDDAIRYPRLYVSPLRSADLFEDAFMLLARDGAGLIEIQLRLQKALQALGRMGDDDFRAAAQEQSTLALARAEAALTLNADKARLKALTNSINKSRQANDHQK